tara:strand:- start:389 stop:580 length:192 start_codon:yes stop_codon:yes gene_type:complete
MHFCRNQFFNLIANAFSIIPHHGRVTVVDITWVCDALDLGSNPSTPATSQLENGVEKNEEKNE